MALKLRFNSVSIHACEGRDAARKTMRDQLQGFISLLTAAKMIR